MLATLQRIVRCRLFRSYFPIAELVTHAANNAVLVRGDILGTGTLGCGCFLEQPDRSYLEPSDEIEL